MLSIQTHARGFRICDLGVMDFMAAYTLQRKTVDEVIRGENPCLFLCEHPPVFTLGRIATTENFLWEESTIRQAGATIERTDRGGEVTFHGPGQLVAYPILNLNCWGRDLKIYLRKLEQVAVDLLSQFGILATPIDGKRGVWVGKRKIASIGIGVRKWVSFHGLAINVNTDLKFFTMIKPCGLDVEMTSIARETRQPADMVKVKQEFVTAFCRRFNFDEMG